MSNGLTKQQRIIAYKMVDEILNRPIPAVVTRHFLAEMTDQEAAEISHRVYHVLNSLRSDAKDLWDES